MHEANARQQLREQLAAASSLRFVAADELGARPVEMFGERVVRILYYALGQGEDSQMIRFRLNAQDEVVSFDDL